GLKGDSDKRAFIMKAMELYNAAVQSRNPSPTSAAPPPTLGGLPVVGAAIYQTGKYDRVNWEGFPDEGIRLYFDESKLDHFTLRPSGTSNALRFHVQLHADHVTRDAVASKKTELRKRAKMIVDDIRRWTGALIDRP